MIDRLLSDEELEQLMQKMLAPHLQEFKAGHTDILLSSFVDLITTQKRLYTESVIGEDEPNQYSGDDCFDKISRNRLRAEQRARIK